MNSHSPQPTNSGSEGSHSEASHIDTTRGGGLVMGFRGARPRFGAGVFLAPTSVVIGEATLGDRVGIWFGSIVRADIKRIEIGADTNIQDLSVLHVADDHPCIIGERVVVGHRAILHGCTVGDEVLIGMGAVVLNGARIGEGSIIAAGTLVTEGKVIPPRSLVMGSPGRIVREVTPEQIESDIVHFAHKYARMGAEYIEQLAGPHK